MDTNARVDNVNRLRKKKRSVKSDKRDGDKRDVTVAKQLVFSLSGIVRLGSKRW